jgi:hypothetical protein
VSGHEYRDLIGRYLLRNFADRGLAVYREVPIGKSVIGKDRRIDIFVHAPESAEAFAIECKFQGQGGTTDEKIPYALEDMRALPMGGCLVYAGEGWSQGVLHMLQSSALAAWCLPGPDLKPGPASRELDHLLAMHFRWWDVLVAGRSPEPPEPPPQRSLI